MLLRKYYAAVLIFAGTLSGCAGNDTKDYVDKSLVTPATENKTVQPPVSNTVSNQAINIQPGAPAVNPTTITTPANNPVNITPKTNAVNITQQSTTVPTNPVASTGKLNPAHGESGHRCDISVGAPLNSAPVQKTTQPPTVINSNQNPATISPQPVAQKVAAGMNPPHGQPGHRCDISVGAPLNSPPAQNANPTQTVTAPVNLTPVKKDSLKN